MYCISDTSSNPPVRSLGPRQAEEVNMGVTNPWSNPSLEQCTWSLSEQSAACCIPASVDHGAFPRVCYCQTPACRLCKLRESQAQRRSLWSLEDRKWSSHFLRGHSDTWFPLYPDVQAGCKDVRGELLATPQGASAGAVCFCCSPVLGWADRCTGYYVEPTIMIKKPLSILTSCTCIKYQNFKNIKNFSHRSNKSALMQVVPEKAAHCLDMSRNHGSTACVGAHLQDWVFRLPFLKTLQHTLSFQPVSMSHQSDLQSYVLQCFAEAEHELTNQGFKWLVNFYFLKLRVENEDRWGRKEKEVNNRKRKFHHMAFSCIKYDIFKPDFLEIRHLKGQGN